MDDNSENQQDSSQGVTPVIGAASTTGAPPPPPPSPTTPSTPPPISPQPSPQPATSIQSEPSQPATPGPPGPEVTTPKEKKSSPVLFIILVVLIFIVWGVVLYLYFTNQKVEDESSGSSDQISVASPTPEPTSSFNPADIEIINGSVYQTTGGENTLLVNKDDYPGTGIAGFATVTVSSDNSLICFEALPPALEPALYYSAIDGTGVTQVGAGSKSCTWSNDNTMLAYINDAAADTAVDIFKYDLASKEGTNLTKVSTTSAVFRRYEIDSWSNDDTTISCNYQKIDPSDPSSEVLGNCEIDVETSEVTDL